MMISRRHVMVIYFSVVAGLWCTTEVFAQERPASPQPTDAGRPAIVVPSDIPWHTLEWIERRYKVEALRFKARDETGWDWTGSDEVMIGTFDAKGWAFSNEIGGIDSGDTHSLDPAKSCIIAVSPGEVILGKTSLCNDIGEPAPLSFRVEFAEKDSQFPFGGFCVIVPGNAQHFTRHCLNYGADDFIGEAQVDLPIQDLETALPRIGDQLIETIVLNPCSNGVDVCDVTYGPDYSFTYRITRLPDVRVGLRGVLDEAMHTIGARSELEAIVAGLRSLRAPSPRKIEPETGNPPPGR